MGIFRLQLDDSFRFKLFDDVLNVNNFTLRKLSVELNSGYSGIKKWRRGEDLIPEPIFNSLLAMSSSKIQKPAVQYIRTKLPDGWGRKKGGDSYAKKYQKIIGKKMIAVRSFRKGLHVPETSSSKTDNDVWELVGAILGDGCLSNYRVRYNNQEAFEMILTGNMNDDLDYYKNRLVPLFKLKFNSKANYHLRPEYHVIYLRIKSKKLFDYFHKLGVPIGKKKNKLRITKQMLSNNISAKASILRGLLDTDGHIFARKDENYKYPYVKITSGSLKFLQDLKNLIREFGLPAYVHDTDVLVRGGENIKLWMSKIGSSNPSNIKRYNVWLSTGKLLPKRALSSAR